MYFLKRIPEPKKMGDLEFKVFERESRKKYRIWMIPLVDDALMTSRLQSGKILDVGCGPGLLVKEFAQRSKKFQVVGIDISPYVIRRARENCQGLKNIVLKKAAASHLPFDDKVFDLVICKDSLHHFNNLERALREMYRVIKSDGTVYLQDLRRDLPWRLLKMAIPPKSLFQKLQYYSARASYTKKELTIILKALGLRSYAIKTRQATQKLRYKYNKAGIDFNQLRASFQSRYVAVIKKS